MIDAIIAALVGIGAGIGGTVVYSRTQVTNSKTKAEQALAKAQEKASEIVLKAKDEAIELENERRKELKKIENRLVERETTLDKKLDELDKRAKSSAIKKMKSKN